MLKIPLEAEQKAVIDKLSLKEKDILVLKTDQSIAPDEAREAIKMIEGVLEKAGYDNQVMLLDGGGTFLVLEDGNLLENISLQPVVSNNILAIGYDGEKQIMRVKFKSNSIYDYKDVPSGHFMKIMVAPSKGKYLNEEIKGKFKFIKVS